MKKKLIICLAILLLLALIITIFQGPIFGYKLTIKNPSYVNGTMKKRYRAGEEVVLFTGITCDANIEAFVNGKSIGFPAPTDDPAVYVYSFDMPARNTTVSFKARGGLLPY